MVAAFGLNEGHNATRFPASRIAENNPCLDVFALYRAGELTGKTEIRVTRAERILKDLENRKTTGLAAMDLLAALAAEKGAAARAAKESGLSAKAFGVFWLLRNESALKSAGIDPMEIARETEALNASVNADEQRRLRAALYRPLLALKEERARIVDLIIVPSSGIRRRSVLPVRIIRPADGGPLSATPLTKNNVVIEAHRLCQPVKVNADGRRVPVTLPDRVAQMYLDMAGESPLADWRLEVGGLVSDRLAMDGRLPSPASWSLCHPTLSWPVL